MYSAPSLVSGVNIWHYYFLVCLGLPPPTTTANQIQPFLTKLLHFTMYWPVFFIYATLLPPLINSCPSLVPPLCPVCTLLLLPLLPLLTRPLHVHALCLNKNVPPWTNLPQLTALNPCTMTTSSFYGKPPSYGWSVHLGSLPPTLLPLYLSYAACSSLLLKMVTPQSLFTLFGMLLLALPFSYIHFFFLYSISM